MGVSAGQIPGDQVKELSSETRFSWEVGQNPSYQCLTLDTKDRLWSWVQEQQEWEMGGAGDKTPQFRGVNTIELTPEEAWESLRPNSQAVLLKTETEIVLPPWLVLHRLD